MAIGFPELLGTSSRIRSSVSKKACLRRNLLPLRKRKKLARLKIDHQDIITQHIMCMEFLVRNICAVLFDHVWRDIRVGERCIQ